MGATSAEAGAVRCAQRPAIAPLCLAGVSRVSPARDSWSSPAPHDGLVAATFAPADHAMRADRRTTEATQGEPMAAAVDGFTCTAAKRGTLPMTREGVCALRKGVMVSPPCASTESVLSGDDVMQALPALKADGVFLCALMGLVRAVEDSRGGLEGTSPFNVRCRAAEGIHGGDGASSSRGAGGGLMADDVMWGGDCGTSSRAGGCTAGAAAGGVAAAS